MMLDLYEQCEYKMQIINKKKKNVGGKGLAPKRHTRHIDNNHSNINNKK